MEKLENESRALTAELSGLGFFDGKRKREIKARLAQVELEKVRLGVDF